MPPAARCWLDIEPDRVTVRLLSFNQPMTEKPYPRNAGGDLVVV